MTGLKRTLLVACGWALVALAIPAAAEMAWTYPQALNNNAATDDGRHDYYPVLATDGAGAWVGVWASRNMNSNGEGYGEDMDIFTAHSVDNGLTWSSPEAVDPVATSDDLHDSTPAVFTDGDGHWLTVWNSWDQGATSDIDLLYATSTNGLDWTVRGFFNSDHDVDVPRDNDQTPDIAIEADGTWIAVWQKRQDSPPGDEGDVELARSTDHGVTWSPVTHLHSSMETDIYDDIVPRIATDGQGNAVVIWKAAGMIDSNGEEDQDIHYSQTSDSGLTWSEPAPLNTDYLTDFVYDIEGDVVTDGNGTWLAVWYRNMLGATDRDLVFSRSFDAGATWSDPQPLNTNWETDMGDDAHPRIVGDGDGHWVVTWYSDDMLGLPIGTDRDVFFARSCDDGAHWTPPGVLNGNAAMDLSAQDWSVELALGADNMLLAAWYSTDWLNGTIGFDRDILYARSSVFVCGDQDTDGDLDLADFAGMQACWGQAASPGDACDVFDFDAGGQIGAEDFAAFAPRLTGPGD